MTLGVVELIIDLRCSHQHERGDLLGTILAGLDHREIGEITEGEPAEELQPLMRSSLVAGLGHTDRHPLLVHLQGRGHPCCVVALAVLMVLRAVGPGVVGDLVVVEDRDERVTLMTLAQVGVGPVLGVAQAVVLQLAHLAVGLMVTVPGERVRAVAVIGIAVLVHVVAQMQYEVDVVAFGECAIHGEVTAGVVGA